MSRHLFKLLSVLTVLTLLALSRMTRADDLIVAQYFDHNAVEILNGTNEGVKFASSNTNRFGAMAFDTNGYLYVAGEGFNNVERFSPTGEDLGNFATTGLNDTNGLAFDQNGNLYVSSNRNNTVRRFSPTGADLGVFASVADPCDLAFDHAGNLYVSSYYYGTIHRFAPTGAGLGIFAQLSAHLAGLAFDTAGNLYVADRTNYQIHRFSPTGADQGVFASAGLNDPNGIAFDSAGNLFVANYGGSTVSEFSPTGSNLGNYATGLDSPVELAFRPVVKALTLTFDALTGGVSGAGTVTLTSAPASPITVTLASSDPSVASVPARITVPAGKTSATFPIITHSVAAYTPATITASLYVASRSALLIVTPAGNPTFTLTPTSVIGGSANPTGTITLPGPAPIAIQIALVSSDPLIASVPSHVTIPAGATSVTFPVTTYPVSSSMLVEILASSYGTSLTTTLMVLP
jgi:sugar lactone lactonase YvrE